MVGGHKKWRWKERNCRGGWWRARRMMQSWTWLATAQFWNRFGYCVGVDERVVPDGWEVWLPSRVSTRYYRCLAVSIYPSLPPSRLGHPAFLFPMYRFRRLRRRWNKVSSRQNLHEYFASMTSARRIV